jgi:hypothetical protein
MKVPLQRQVFDTFYNHVTQTAAELEEIAGDLYSLESLISLARDTLDLKLYQAHCRRLEATIYTLHEKIGSWQHSARNSRARFPNDQYNTQAMQLDEALMLVDGYITNVCHYEEKIMRLQKMILDQKSTFVVTQQIAGERELVA